MSQNNLQNTKYSVETEEFSGPLHLLLELIENSRLPITDVSLSKVTGQFLDYIESEEVPSEALADFLVIATRLLYLKSRELMPDVEDDEESEINLASQLRLYKIFADASVLVDGRYNDGVSMWPCAKPILPKLDYAVMPSELDSRAIELSFEQLLKRIRPFLYFRKTTIERVRSVSERMKELRALIKKRVSFAFRDLTMNAKSKMDVVLNFLALLELVKERAVKTTQSKTFSDITINRI
jgi:segregation and condensation protein A